jgi:hypothetical protein
MKRGADMPMPCNVAAVLRYAAKIIEAGNALYLSTANNAARVK